MQKRVLAMLLQLKKNPAKLDELIETFSLEMEEEDVALVEKKLK